MIATSVPMFIVLALGCLVLNFFAFRATSNAAGHTPRRLLRMAAIWVTLIVGLTLLIGSLQS